MQRRDWLWAAGPALLVAAVAVAHWLPDGDGYWHLKTGLWILAHGRVPHTDIWSFTARGRPWVDQSWLWQVVAGWLWLRLGVAGLLALEAAELAAASVVAWRWAVTRGADPALAALGSALAGGLTAFAFPRLRPELATPALLLLVLYLLYVGPRRPGVLWGIPPLTLLWANLHGSVVLAPLAVAGTLLVPPALRPSGYRRRLAAVLASTCLAALANPWGAGLYVWAFRTAAGPAVAHISEWNSPSFHDPGFLAVLLGAGALGLWGLLRGSRPASGELAVWALLLGVATLYSARFLLYLLPLGPVLAASLLTGRRLAGHLYAAVLAAAVALVAVRLNPPASIAPPAPLTMHAEWAAARWVTRHLPGRRSFGSGFYEAYLIWDGVPVLWDGRADFYADVPSEVAGVSLQALMVDLVTGDDPALDPGPVLAHYGIDAVVVDRLDPGLAWWVRAAGWHAAWRLDGVTVWTRPGVAS